MLALKEEYLPSYSYEDYKYWEGDWELIGGIAYSISPSPIKNHQMLVGFIFSEMMSSFDECLECDVLIDLDWKINSKTVLKPDISLVRGDKNKKFISKTPEIIFEVISFSTAKKDEGLKFEIYQQEGVKYYILIYPNELIAKIYKNSDNGYKKIGEFDDEVFNFEEIKSPFKFNFENIFKRFRR